MSGETPGGLIIVWLSCANCSCMAACVAAKDLKAASTSAISNWGAPDWNLALHPRAAEKAPDDWSVNLKWLTYLSEHYPSQAQETTVLEHLWLVEEALAGVLNALNVEAGDLDQDAVKRVSNQLNAMYSSVAKRHWTRLRTSRQHR